MDVYLNVDEQDDITLLPEPRDLNYPDAGVVLDGVTYGFDQQFNGTYISLGGGPPAPELSLLHVENRRVQLHVVPEDTGSRSYILYRRTYSNEDFSAIADEFSVVGEGDITVTGLTDAISYDFIAVSTLDGNAFSLPSNMVSATPGPEAGSSIGAGFFSRIWVDNLMEQGAVIYWELGNIPCDVEGPFFFTAQWARTVNGEWQDTGASPVVDGYYTIDPVKRLWAKQIDLWYRVRVTTHSGETYYSEPARADGGLPWKDWQLAREITRKEYLRLLKYVGTHGELFRRRDWGDICPDCTDYDTGERIKENCLTCFDTGYVGGYYPPVDYWIAVENHQQRLRRDDNAGMNADITMTGRCLPYPYPQSGDVWVSHEDGRRYFVQTVAVASKIRARALILQAELRLIPAGNIVYRM